QRQQPAQDHGHRQQHGGHRALDEDLRQVDAWGLHRQAVAVSASPVGGAGARRTKGTEKGEITGGADRVSTWLTSSPPTITRPSGWRSSAPEPLANIIGIAANSAASVVIRIGRKRSSAARWIASRGAMPCSRSASSAKSIIMIAFFF